MANIAASLIAILAFVAFLNGILAWMGSLVHIDGLTFEWVLGKMFIPLAWLMGIDTEVKLFINLLGHWYIIALQIFVRTWSP